MKRIDVNPNDIVEVALAEALKQGRIEARVDEQGRTYYVPAKVN